MYYNNLMKLNHNIKEKHIFTWYGKEWPIMDFKDDKANENGKTFEIEPKLQEI